MYGRYRGEKGVKLGVSFALGFPLQILNSIQHLERIIGSRNLASALKLIYRFRALDVLSIVLFFMWSLSPLGGQSTLRMLVKTHQNIATSKQFEYLNTYSSSDYAGLSAYIWLRPIVHSLYISSLIAPNSIKKGPVDSWGNVKIPVMDLLDQSNQDEEGVVVKYDSNLQYTSLLGIPFNGTLSSARFASFNLNVTSYAVKCSEPVSSNRVDNPPPVGDGTFVFRTNYVPLDRPERYVTMITFPITNASRAINHNCSITPNPVLAKVDCLSGDCAVTRMKRVSDASDHEAAINLREIGTWGRFTENFPAAFGPQHDSSNTPTERYLLNPEMSPANRSDFQLNIADIPIADLNVRLTTLVNTYYHATIAPEARLGGVEFGKFKAKNVSVEYTDLVTIYKCIWAWFAIALCSSIGLLAIGIAGVIFQHSAIGPDIYGYVSSMTRDNAYCTPTHACTNDGLKRAFLMKDAVVQVRDVLPRAIIGHIAFVTVDSRSGGGLNDGRLNMERPYSGDY